MNAVDTNILLYAHDRRDERKQAIALDLIRVVPLKVLPWQVGCEFIAAARKMEQMGFAQADAWDALADFRAGCERIILPTERVWDRARQIQLVHTLSIWDALLVAACLEGEVTTLYSEDMGSPRKIETLQIINPFAE